MFFFFFFFFYSCEVGIDVCRNAGWERCVMSLEDGYPKK